MSGRTLRRIVPFVVLTLVFAALLYRAEHKAESGISHVDQHVTEITSPCLRYGANSRQCRRSFEAAVATIDHPEACAVERKAGTLKALRELAHSLDVNFKEPCKGARLAQERQRGNERRQAEETAGEPPRTGGDATSAPTGSSQPGRHDGGSGGQAGSHGAPGPGEGGSHGGTVPGDGGSGGTSVPGEHDSTTPAAPPSESSSQSSSSSTTARTTETTVVESAPEPEAPVRTGLGTVVESGSSTAEGLGEAAGGAVEESGHTVNETVHGVTCGLGVAC